jgi:hypothetical protein
VQRRPVVESTLAIGPEHGPDDLVLFQQDPYGFGFVDASLIAVAAGILPKRALKVLRNADVVHDQTGRLVTEDAVDAGDGLHEPVSLHRLIHIHRMHTGGIESGQPHIPHDHELKRVLGVFGTLCH